MRGWICVPTAVAMLFLGVGCELSNSPSADVRSEESRPGALAQVSAAALFTNPGPTCVGARSPGFYCQNQDGKNPNLTADEFQQLAIAAAALLATVAALDTPEEIAAAVCNNRDQLLRQLATLALNLAANLIDETTPLVNEPYATVGDAFQAAIAIANDPTATKADRNAIKDVLDRINNNENTVLGDECVLD